jgi:sugar lactone lactonase YvrE
LENSDINENGNLIDMRIFTILVLPLAFFTSARADTPNVNAAAGFSKIELAQELSIVGMRKLLGWSDGNIYFAKKDGSVSEVGKDGKEIQVLQAKDAKGAPILNHPEMVAVSNGTIYVVDSEANLVAMFSSRGKFLGSFGAKSSGGFFSNGNKNALNSPRGIAIRDGIVYVADSGNGRVQLFGINGVFLATLEIDSAPENNDAKEKGLPYNLHRPTDIAIDALGQIYVLDSDDGLIKVYSPNAVYLKHLPKTVKALTFTLAHDGVYVVDRDSFVINKYDFKNKLVYTFGSRGNGRAQFEGISGFSTDMDRQVLVGDSEKGIADVFNVESGKYLEPVVKQPSRTSVRWDKSIALPVKKMAWDGKGALYGIIADDKDDGNKIVRIVDGTVTSEIRTKDFSPVSVAVDQNGALWALDKKKAMIAKLDESGKILFKFGLSGNREGYLDDPEDFAISKEGVVFIADSGNHRIQAFSSDGVFLKAITSDTSGKLESPTEIALDPTDGIYVLDKNRAVISVYSSKGVPLGVIGNQNGSTFLEKPIALMVTQDEVFVLDSDQVKVFSHKGQYIRSFGTHGSGRGEFDEPLGIVSSGETIFSISERGNKRLQSFTTLYKPSAPERLTAQGAVHAIELHWAASDLPYIKQYLIFRAEGEKTAGEKLQFVQIAVSSTDHYADQNVEVGKTYYYQIEGETQYGFVGPMSDMVSGAANKYVPPALQNVKIEPSPFQIKLSWKPVDQKYFSIYLIYQNLEDNVTKIGETTKPEYVISGLTPSTDYKYYITTLSTDGIESDKFEVNTSTPVSSAAPLEINIVKLRDIFSNTYKLYEQDGIGRIALTNNTDMPIEKIKVSFMLNNYMDFPTDQQIDSLLPGQSQEIVIKAVFNNNILTISEDSSIQSTIEASYFQDGTRQVYTKNIPITVYNKHRMTWDEHERLASFITPKDTPIMNFARSIATEFHDTKDETQLASVLFDAMGAIGFTYIQNPIDPYQISIAKTTTTAKTDTVDYVQYPRETMERKSGDCVDLVAFYATALESVGISTLMLEVPDHLLMMFSTGISADSDGYTMNNMYVIHDGKLWIPVETTVVGSPFTKAWDIGAANYYKWKGRGLNILDVHQAWNTFKPPTLPDSQASDMRVSAQEIENKFPGNFSSILKISSQTKTRRYLQALEKNPDDMQAHLQIGIILAKVGEHEEAMKYFDKVLKADQTNAAAVNDRGNIFMLDGNYSEAQKAYSAATKLSPDDPYVWINLAKSYMATKDTKRAKNAFVKAKQLDASVKEKYKTMSLELLNTL